MDEAARRQILLRFFSEEDLDLRNLDDDEFWRLSAEALRQAQASNHVDERIYRHGCIAVEPGHEHLLPMIRSGAI